MNGCKVTKKLTITIIGILSAALIGTASFRFGYKKGHETRYSNPPTQEEVERTVEIIETYNSMFSDASDNSPSSKKKEHHPIDL